MTASTVEVRRATGRRRASCPSLPTDLWSVPGEGRGEGRREKGVQAVAFNPAWLKWR